MGNRVYGDLLLALANWVQGGEVGRQGHYPVHNRKVLPRLLNTNVTPVLLIPFRFISWPITRVFSRAQKKTRHILSPSLLQSKNYVVVQEQTIELNCS
jgi:hypothetical protein